MRSTQVKLHLFRDVENAAGPPIFDLQRRQRIETGVERLFGFDPSFKVTADFDEEILTSSSGITTQELAQEMALLPPPPPSTGWFARVLIARSSILINPSPLGALFDLGARVGCAVFISTIRSAGFAFEPLLIRTIAHELGHVFNLAHEDGATPLNELMHEGPPTQAQIDHPELRAENRTHLMTHAEAFVRPGGGPFLTTRACIPHPAPDLGGDAGNSSAARAPRIALKLHVHRGTVYRQTRVPTLVIGEPLHVTAEVVNDSARPVLVPRWPSTATQNLVLQRSATGTAARLLPPVLFCCGGGKERWRRLRPGERIAFHETLLFRNGELVFPREGTYELSACLQLRRGWIGSERQKIRVAPPLKRRQERACDLAADPAVGRFVELGGAPDAGGAEGNLAELRRVNPEFPLHAVVRLLHGREAVLAPRSTPLTWRRRLAKLGADRRLPEFVRTEARLLLALDQAQRGDTRAAARLARRLGTEDTVPIPGYSAMLIRRGLQTLMQSNLPEENS